MPLIHTAAAITVCFIAGTSVSAAEKLAWKFSPGDTFKLTFAQQSDAEAAVRGAPARMKTSMLAEFTWNVKEAGEEAATLIQTLTRMKVTVIAGESAPVEYDSAADDSPRGRARDLENSLKPVVGGKWELQINPRGEVISARPAGGELDPKTVPPAIAELFSESGMEKLLGPALGLMPQGEVIAGDTWEQEREVDTPLGKITQLTTYRLDRVAEGIAHINATAESTLASEGETKLKEQSQTGELAFDIDAGRLTSCTVKQSLVTEKPFQDRTITVTVKTESKVEIKDE